MITAASAVSTAIMATLIATSTSVKPLCLIVVPGLMLLYVCLLLPRVKQVAGRAG